ncbi:MAG TPA: glycosyl hydrolase [Ohtaekwangia sp.]
MTPALYTSIIIVLLGITSCGSKSVSDAPTLALQPEKNYDSLLALKEISKIERKLTTPDPSKEAVALYRYLLDIYGKKMLSGQMCVPWGYGELKYLQEKTGKQPALRGIDFIHQRDNDDEVQHAIDWWKSGGIPTIMWHWGGPGIGEGYENSKGSLDIEKCFIEGTKEHTAFWSELKTKADLLEELRDAHIPILWRPYHEFNGHWFWYSKQGPEPFKKLWVTMYNYFVHERKLNNLIWVLCYTGNPDVNWYPGDEYVDIAGADTYDGGDDPHLGMYSGVKEIVKNNPMPICYHECGVPPDPDDCWDQGAIWLWWMEWHTDHLKKIDDDYLNKVYHHDLVITKDELPDIMKVYGE